MKFLVDAQLPYGIALFLRDKGFDALHTNDLPDKEYTTDSLPCVQARQNL
jgi:predicted nuclease of predicted toxin-antitoxin system